MPMDKPSKTLYNIGNQYIINRWLSTDKGKLGENQGRKAEGPSLKSRWQPVTEGGAICLKSAF